MIQEDNCDSNVLQTREKIDKEKVLGDKMFWIPNVFIINRIKHVEFTSAYIKSPCMFNSGHNSGYCSQTIMTSAELLSPITRHFTASANLLSFSPFFSLSKSRLHNKEKSNTKNNPGLLQVQTNHHESRLFRRGRATETPFKSPRPRPNGRYRYRKFTAYDPANR